MSETTLVSILITLVGVIAAAAVAYFVKINAKLSAQDVEIATLKTQVSPLWAQVQARIAADLHHPHPRYFEMDGLLEKLEALTITKEERARLKVLLTQRASDVHPDISAEQRSKAALMMQVMDLVVEEHKQVKEDANLEEGLQGIAKQTLRNVDKAKVAATIVVQQIELQTAAAAAAAAKDKTKPVNKPEANFEREIAKKKAAKNEKPKT